VVKALKGRPQVVPSSNTVVWYPFHRYSAHVNLVFGVMGVRCNAYVRESLTHKQQHGMSAQLINKSYERALCRSTRLRFIGTDLTSVY